MARLSYIVLSTACCDAATLAVLLTAVVVEVGAATVAVAVDVDINLALLGIFAGALPDNTCKEANNCNGKPNI